MTRPSKQLRPLVLEGCTVLTPAGWLRPGRLVLNGDRIDTIAATALPRLAGCRVISAHGLLAVPGLIDLHLHGGGGHDVMEGSPAALAAIGRWHACHGTTSWLAASVAAPPADWERLCRAAAGVSRSSGLLGIYLEGGLLAPGQWGAQPGEQVQPGQLLNILNKYPRLIRVVVIAPEEPPAADLLRVARLSGVVVAIGHTAASYSQAAAGIKAGVRLATHTFNSMPAWHHRHPGAAGAVIDSPEVLAEVIADGFHLHPATVRLLLRAKGLDGVVAITDASAATGAPPGRYPLGSQQVASAGPVARLDNGVLAGSCLTMERALRNLLRWTGMGLEQIIPLLTTNPARALGLEQQKGRLESGYDADVVLLDQRLRVRLTVIGGKIVHARGINAGIRNKESGIRS